MTGHTALMGPPRLEPGSVEAQLLYRLLSNERIVTVPTEAKDPLSAACRLLQHLATIDMNVPLRVVADSARQRDRLAAKLRRRAARLDSWPELEFTCLASGSVFRKTVQLVAFEREDDYCYADLLLVDAGHVRLFETILRVERARQVVVVGELDPDVRSAIDRLIARSMPPRWEAVPTEVILAGAPA